MNKYLHYLSMLVVFLGGLSLIYLASVWYSQDNTLMGSGMLIMGLIALANSYLHLRSMRKK